MCRVNGLIRTLTLVAAGALAISPLFAAAASTPSPSPSLDKVLAAPPGSDFTELTTGVLHGEFTAHDWATTNASGSDATETEKTLTKDGFVDGYGKTWAQASAGHAMIEAVMAFTGGQGARKALTSLEASDKSDKSYKHADTISGIDPYYGAHFADSSSNTVGDLFVFVKGNDVFFVILASQKDDVLTVATSQAKAQYAAAPAGTIPTADWPENAPSPTSGSSAALGFGIIGAIVVVVAIAIVFLLMRRRGAAAPAMMAAVGGAGAGGVQLSPDGNYWYDGQTWRDAAHEAPPAAQRSSDGTLWWDGRNWRPVPQAAQPEQPPTS
jgi:hypothetical protein